MRKILNRKLAVVALAVALLSSFARGEGAGPSGTVRVVICFHGKPDPVLVQRFGGTVAVEVASSGALAARLPLGAVEEIQRDPAVASVEPDAEITITGRSEPSQPDETIPSGILQIGADVAWGFATGSGVRVAVIDTGIDERHPDLAGHVEMGENFVNGKRPIDDNGHGTLVAGVIGAIDNAIGVVGVAPEVRLYAVKALNRRGSGWLSDAAAGVDWAVANGMQVVNMSFSASSNDALLAAACENAERAGVVLVASAGNAGNAPAGGSTVRYPGALPSVIAVSAVDEAGRIASFSSTGPEVDFAAPGVGILTTVMGGTYAAYNGSSLAAPHVSGTAALVFSRGVTDSNGNGRVNDEVRSILAASARDLGEAGRDDLFGDGLVHALGAVLWSR